jgi:hypothetical protein
MRAGIRQALIDNIPELNNCYEPNVPSKETLKPYAVILQGTDEEESAPVSFVRNIEIWLYEKRTTFKKLDYLYNQVVEVLHLKTIIDPATNQSFTCVFDGTIGQDVVDEEWDAIARGLTFKVIGLYNDSTLVSADEWVEAISKYTETLINVSVYRDCFKNSINTPSILWRAIDVNQNMINACLLNVEKTLVCHAVSDNRKQIQDILNTIRNDFTINVKLPLNTETKKYLTVASIQENREADMLTTGQLTLTVNSKYFIQEDIPSIEKIYAEGKIK